MKHYKILSLIFLFFLASCAYYNTFYNAKYYFNEAQKIMRKTENKEKMDAQAIENLDKAISKSKKVLYKYPDSRWSDNAQYIIAISTFYKGNYESAREEFESFLYEYPESKLQTKANIWYGKTLWNLDQKEAARREWKTAAREIESDKLMSELFFLIGDSFRENNRLDSAATYYKKVVNLKKNDRRVESLFHLVNISLKKKRNEEAVEYLNQLSDMVLMPEELNRLQVLQIKIYRQQEDYEKARTVINKKLNSESFKEIWGALELQLALIYKEEGNIEKALSRLNNITENYKNTEEAAHAYYLLGESNTFMKQNYDQAAEYYAQVPKASSKSEYANEAREKNKILTEFKDKNQSYHATQDLINLIENKTSALDSMVLDSLESDSLSREDLKKKVEEQKEAKVREIDTLATYEKYYRLQYEIAEIYYFELNLQDTARTIYQRIANNYKYNPYVSKSIYALYFLNKMENKQGQAKYYRQRLEQEFPDSPYLSFIKNGELPQEQKELAAQNLFHKAERYIAQKPDSSVQIFKEVVKRYPQTEYSKKGVLNLGWLYNNRFYLADSALKWFNYYKTNYPEGEEIDYVNTKIAELNAIVKQLNEVENNTDSVENNQTPDSLETSSESSPPQDSLGTTDVLPDSLAPQGGSQPKSTEKDSLQKANEPAEFDHHQTLPRKKKSKEDSLKRPDKEKLK